ncbi:ribonuclease H-like domain-containing protein [Nemania sp. NC0429]|nr:ribonuclease H-like domain-containing protein [Nemania sp. NC0429]
MGQQRSDENSDAKHDPHRANKPEGTCNLFPPLDHYLHEEASCGLDNLEVIGFKKLIHVRCPWASDVPCRCGRHSLHLDSLVVAVDGACPGNGTDNATKSAYGVFFGPGSPDNLALRVPNTPGYSHTSQRAELSAAIAAIQASQRYIYNGGQWICDDCPTPCTVRHLVIKSDSAYLVNGMTAHVQKWRNNGWRTAKNTEVKNQDLWIRLDNLVQQLYAGTGVGIDFWHVPRDQNTDADSLANRGLEKWC